MSLRVRSARAVLREGIVHVALPVAVGVLIYAIFRYPAFDALGVADDLPAWVRYNLPDGLWAYATISIASLPWRENSPHLYLWMLLSFVVVLGYELLQLPNLVPGVFDPMDVLASVLGLAFGGVLALRRRRRHEFDQG